MNNKVKLYCRSALASVVAGVAFAQSAMAQQSAAFLERATSEAQAVRNAAFNIVKVGLVVVGLITLVMAIANVVKGEREAAGKLAWWVVGIALGFGFVTILQSMV